MTAFTFQFTASPTPDEKMPRVRCLTCRDTGLVTIAHPKIVRFVKNAFHYNDVELPANWRSHEDYPREAGNGQLCVRCHCNQGQAKKNKEGEQSLATYDAGRMCAVDYPPHDASKILQWLDERLSGAYCEAKDFTWNG